MGIRQQVIRRVVRALLIGLAPAAAATGCATFAGLSKDLDELSVTAVPNPANNIACTWQNRIANLPDPLRNGAPTPGIAGQVFLFDVGYQPSEAAGELTVGVSDATPRPPGQAGPTPEAWHFTTATLKNLRYVDERIGRCYIVFLPWPATWKDVTKVRFQVRYDQPNGPTLYAQDAEVTLDFTPGPTGQIPGTAAGGSVPNPADMLKQARAAQSSGRTTPPGTPTPPAGVRPTAGVQPATHPQVGTWGPSTGYHPQPQAQPYPTGTYTPPPTGAYPPPTGAYNPPTGGYAPPTGYYGPPQGSAARPPAVTTPPAGGPPGAGGVQPVAVPYRPPGAELASPGPPEVRTRFP